MTDEPEYPDDLEIRDHREPRHFWADNEITDLYLEHMSIYTFAIYMLLARYVNSGTAQCDPSIATLAKKISVSHTTVKIALRRLEALGLITIEDRSSISKSGKMIHRTNLYTLLKVKGKLPVVDHDETGTWNDLPHQVTQGGPPDDPGVGHQESANNTDLNKNDQNNISANRANALSQELDGIQSKSQGDYQQWQAASTLQSAPDSGKPIIPAAPASSLHCHKSDCQGLIDGDLRCPVCGLEYVRDKFGLIPKTIMHDRLPAPTSATAALEAARDKPPIPLTFENLVKRDGGLRCPIQECVGMLDWNAGAALYTCPLCGRRYEIDAGGYLVPYVAAVATGVSGSSPEPVNDMHRFLNALAAKDQTTPTEPLPVFDGLSFWYTGWDMDRAHLCKKGKGSRTLCKFHPFSYPSQYTDARHETMRLELCPDCLRIAATPPKAKAPRAPQAWDVWFDAFARYFFGEAKSARVGMILHGSSKEKCPGLIAYECERQSKAREELDYARLADETEGYSRWLLAKYDEVKNCNKHYENWQEWSKDGNRMDSYETDRTDDDNGGYPPAGLPAMPGNRDKDGRPASKMDAQ